MLEWSLAAFGECASVRAIVVAAPAELVGSKTAAGTSGAEGRISDGIQPTTEGKRARPRTR